MDNYPNKPGGESAPKESLKPPLQPLEIKKAGHPPLFLFFLIALGFGVAAAAFAFFSKTVTKKALPAPLPKAAAKPATIVEVVGPSASVPKEETAPAGPSTPIPTLSLSGILFGEQGSLALINGRVVHEGAMVEGAKLEKIAADHVELSFEGKKITLRAR